MYTVEVKILNVHPSITYPLTEVAEPEWFDLATVPRLQTEQAELQEARELVNVALRYYREVRITKSVGDRLRKVVA